VTIKRRALILGVSGQDGSYLARHLLEQGYEVYGARRNGLPPTLCNHLYLGISERVKLITLDINMLADYMRIVKEIMPDEIYNLTSQSSVSKSLNEPFHTLYDNYSSTLNLLEAVRLLNCNSRIYNAVSSEMYGEQKQLPVDENSILNPQSPYAVSKASSFMLVREYRSTYGLYCCNGIMFNHESYLRPIHYVTKKIINTAVRISRGDKCALSLGNIGIKRDWGYAPEYVKAMPLMLRCADPDDYVIATGRSYELKEFVRCVFGILDMDYNDYLTADRSLMRPNDIKDMYGDASKARNVLGWNYTMKFDQMVSKLVKEEIAAFQS
jgi:GDPmannose 4,6-dehydratase